METQKWLYFRRICSVWDRNGFIKKSDYDFRITINIADKLIHRVSWDGNRFLFTSKFIWNLHQWFHGISISPKKCMCIELKVAMQSCTRKSKLFTWAGYKLTKRFSINFKLHLVNNQFEVGMNRIEINISLSFDIRFRHWQLHLSDSILLKEGYKPIRLTLKKLCFLGQNESIL